MSFRISIRPRAARDLDDIAEYLGKRSQRTAEQFQVAVDQTLRSIAEMPELGSVHTQLKPRRQELRWWPIRKFKKYLIFYCILEEMIDIVRVLHGARDLDAILKEEALE